MALSNYTQRYSAEDHAHWEGEWELWSGFPVALKPSPGLEHQLVSGALIGELRRALEKAGCRDCLAVQELDWRVDEETVLRPDLVVLCERPKTRYITQTPPLLVEILSHSARQRDLLYKRDIYEKLGVGTYLIADPDNRTVTLLRRTADGFSESASPLIELSRTCKIELELSGLFAQL